MQGDTVRDSGHTEFTYTIMDVVTGCIFVDWLRARPQGQVRRCQVSRATQEFRKQRTERFDRILRRFTAGDFRWVRLQLSDELVRFRVEVRRHFTFHTTGEFSRFLWEGFSVSRELLVPGGFFRLTRLFGIPLSINIRWNFESRVFPAQRFTRQCDFRVAQWRTVRIVGARFVR